MAKPVDTGVLQIPSVSARHRARFSDWEQGRGFHQGPRSPVPHIEAGHMTAPDRGASHQNALASTGPYTHDTAALRREIFFVTTLAPGATDTYDFYAELTAPENASTLLITLH